MGGPSQEFFLALIVYIVSSMGSSTVIALTLLLFPLFVLIVLSLMMTVVAKTKTLIIPSTTMFFPLGRRGFGLVAMLELVVEFRAKLLVQSRLSAQNNAVGIAVSETGAS